MPREKPETICMTIQAPRTLHAMVQELLTEYPGVSLHQMGKALIAAGYASAKSDPDALAKQLGRY